MQHMAMSVSTRVRGLVLVESDSNISCMYTMYPPEDENLWLEKCRGILFYK